MNRITFYSLHHAQSLDNLNKIFTGCGNSDLSLEGINQAKKLYLKNYTIITCSSIQCVNTIKLGGAVNYELDFRLRDICLGKLEGQSNLPNSLDYIPNGGESYELVYYRVISVLYELMYRLTIRPKINYLLCTSNNVIKILKAIEYKPPIDDFHSLNTENCKITQHNISTKDIYSFNLL